MMPDVDRSGPIRVSIRMPGRPAWPRALPRRFARAAAAAAAVVLALAVLAIGTSYRWTPVEATAAPTASGPRIPKALRAGAPRGTYLVIDRTNNRFWLRKGDAVVREGVCSAGSGHVLEAPDGQKSWTFDTPQGRFPVRGKVEDPVWRKPDWAFVEEGEPIPQSVADRIEYGTLGEYALVLGDGYMVHGTLYERLLGRSVTHGCIRLGRDDLRVVYRAMPTGAPVIIY